MIAGSPRAGRVPVVRLAVFLLLLASSPTFAVPLDSLDDGGDWRLGAVRFEGNEAVRSRHLRSVMVTKPRAWYAFWRPRPRFDPVTFETDVKRVEAVYRERGHYHASVSGEVEISEDGEVVVGVVSIEEGPVAGVVEVNVSFGGAPLPLADQRRLVDGMPFKEGAPFRESAYREGEAYLRREYRELGYARVVVTRKATVDVRDDTVSVSYAIESGPVCVFGEVVVEGTKKVDPSIVLREVAFQPNVPFRQSLIDRTRDNLLALNLFQPIRITLEGAGSVVDVRIRVQEQPPREIRFGVGFDTEELFRGTARWRHFNFLGGARQFTVSVRASTIQQGITAAFLQPHFPLANSKSTLTFMQTRETEEPFTLDLTRVSPRVDWQMTDNLRTFLFYRFEYDSVFDVNSTIESDFPEIVPRDGILSGAGLGFSWNRTDDRIYPHRGWSTTATVEPVGDFLGGEFSFVRLTWEGRAYRRIAGRLIGALRLRLGAADPIGSSDEIPNFERFYSGGINSVRGYGRWRVGPIVGGDPLGGRTRVDWSVELRHPIGEDFGAVVFCDAGQVSLRSWDFPFDRLQYGAGVGARYLSPVGPIGLDLGFPNDPRDGDPAWRVHLGIGAAF